MIYFISLELWVYIFQNLKNLSPVALTCKKFKGIIDNHFHKVIFHENFTELTSEEYLIRNIYRPPKLYIILNVEHFNYMDLNYKDLLT